MFLILVTIIFGITDFDLWAVSFHSFGYNCFFMITLKMQSFLYLENSINEINKNNFIKTNVSWENYDRFYAVFIWCTKQYTTSIAP
ncbi:MAG: hypothetical protein CVV23_14770 [Ignavibacteriae bacterium HGW-Ignavibacteriae-2]|nr:MAG: hypothetical protein CVV23_14770 [Ignavibacteriae bacterium HGW-Ignavibacteriae-2]